MAKIIISIVAMIISVLSDTPIDRIERIIALRCSKARPIVLCTINKPTAKLSKPNADKFK